MRIYRNWTAHSVACAAVGDRTLDTTERGRDTDRAIPAGSLLMVGAILLDLLTVTEVAQSGQAASDVSRKISTKKCLVRGDLCFQ